MFYARAKQTFLTPGSEYELNLTTALLAPFHTPNLPPHPHPELFREIELETYRMLSESLRRFVQAQLNNVGNKRVLCGIVAGIGIALIGAFLPLTLNLARGDSRWPRLAALPGLWLGLTVLFSALNGICLGVYFFGDLRQLRKFELSRPPISKPQPLPPYKRPSTRPVSMTNSILPMQHPRQSTTIHPARTGPHPPLTRIPSSSSATTRTTLTSSQVTSTDDGIHISPAYYDADEIDDDVIYSYAYDSERDTGFPLDKQNERNNADPLDPTTVTATFIRPFEMADDEEDLERSLQLPSRHQSITPFDFDSLPARPNFKATTPRPVPLQFKEFIAQQVPSPPQAAAPSSFMARMQEKCNIAKWRLQTGYLEPEIPTAAPPPHPSSPYWSGSSPASPTTTKRPSAEFHPNSKTEDPEIKARKGFRMISAVPAFAVPLTRILSPVIMRGQWEIVVRSALVALLFSWILLGGLLAVPPLR